MSDIGRIGSIAVHYYLKQIVVLLKVVHDQVGTGGDQARALERVGPGAAGFVDPSKVVTNGPYTITEVVPQSHVLLTKNPNYWDAANVKIEQVKYHVTEDVATEFKRFQAGEIDITYDVPVNMLEELKTSMPDALKVSPSTETTYYS